MVHTRDDDTRTTVESLYRSHLAGDRDGVFSHLSEDVKVSFLGRNTMKGVLEFREFIAANAGSLRNLDFQIQRIVVDGDTAAVIWEETAETASGAEYYNHGVDILQVQDGKVVALHEHDDVTRHAGVFDV